MTSATPIQIEYMRLPHITAAMTIELQATGRCHSLEWYKNWLFHEGGIVAVDADTLYGFALYQRFPDHIYVQQIFVAAANMDDVTRLMMGALKHKVMGERTSLVAALNERDVAGQMELKRHGFEWFETWADEAGDAYLFRWLRPIKPTEPAMQGEPVGVNRVGALL
jgi:hypothetical protein